MTVYKTRYMAKKNCSGDEKVVKVYGGYAVMTWSEYNVWKKQK